MLIKCMYLAWRTKECFLEVQIRFEVWFSIKKTKAKLSQYNSYVAA